MPSLKDTHFQAPISLPWKLGRSKTPLHTETPVSQRAGKILTGERNFSLVTIEENPKLSRSTLTPNEQSSHFLLKPEMGKLQGLSSRLGPGFAAGNSPCPGHTLLNFPTFFWLAAVFLKQHPRKLWSCFTAHTWMTAGSGWSSLNLVVCI